jgi:hypothetical protein
MSVFITPLALVVELSLNKIPVRFRHILVPAGLFFVYLAAACVLSALMDEPLYGKNLTF